MLVPEGSRASRIAAGETPGGRSSGGIAPGSIGSEGSFPSEGLEAPTRGRFLGGSLTVAAIPKGETEGAAVAVPESGRTAFAAGLSPELDEVPPKGDPDGLEAPTTPTRRASSDALGFSEGSSPR